MEKQSDVKSDPAYILQSLQSSCRQNQILMGSSMNSLKNNSFKNLNDSKK